MQNEQSQIITARFFEAIARLRNEGALKGVKTFTDRYGINRWNFISASRDMKSNIFQVAWLAHLVKDYGVSPLWLLTGEGDFYEKPATDMQVKNEQFVSVSQ